MFEYFNAEVRTVIKNTGRTSDINPMGTTFLVHISLDGKC